MSTENLKPDQAPIIEPLDEIAIQMFCDDLTLFDSLYFPEWSYFPEYSSSTTHFHVLYCNGEREFVFKLS